MMSAIVNRNDGLQKGGLLEFLDPDRILKRMKSLERCGISTILHEGTSRNTDKKVKQKQAERWDDLSKNRKAG